jgi:hypothetical protein
MRTRSLLRLAPAELACAVVFLAVGAPRAEAQRGLRPVTYRPESRVQLSAMVTYQWGGTLHTTAGDLKLDDTENYVGVLNFQVRPGARGELYYSYQPTTLRRTFGAQDAVPMNVHYFQLGGRYEPVRQGRMSPFLSGTAGAVLFDAGRSASGIAYGSTWEFAFRFALGTTAMLTQRVGLRGEIGMLLPIFWSTGGFACGPAGCFGTVTGNAVVQGTVGGGLTIAF